VRRVITICLNRRDVRFRIIDDDGNTLGNVTTTTTTTGFHAIVVPSIRDTDRARRLLVDNMDGRLLQTRNARVILEHFFATRQARTINKRDYRPSTRSWKVMENADERE